MLTCNACHVQFTGNLRRCPLCQGSLQGDDVTPSPLPSQRVFLQSQRLAANIVIFAAGALIIFAIFFAWLFSWPWRTILASCLTVVITALYAVNAIRQAIGPLRLLMRGFYLVLAASLIWLLITPNTIITTYIIPITTLAALGTSVVLLLVMKSDAFEYFFKYFVFNVIFGLLPLIFIPLGLAPWYILIAISAMVSVLFALALIVFAHRQIRREFSKQFRT